MGDVLVILKRNIMKEVWKHALVKYTTENIILWKLVKMFLKILSLARIFLN